MKMKKCPKCELEFPETKEFFCLRNDTKKFVNICRKCKDLRSKAYREENPEKIREKGRKYYQNNKEKIRERKRKYYQNNKERMREKGRKYYQNNLEKILLKGARLRARKNGLDFALEESDLIIPNNCPVLGIPIKIAFGNRTQSANSPTLDRIDNNKGYVKDNVMIISWRANNLKNNATVEEMEKIYKFYKGLENRNEGNRV